MSRRVRGHRRRSRGERAALGHRARRSWCCSTAARRTRTRGTRCARARTARSSRSTCPVTGTPTAATTTRTGRARTRPPSRSRCARSRPTPRAVVGMSLGGLTALALAARAPDLVRTLVLVDVTPGVDRAEGVGDRAVHQRARELRELRRDPRAHDRVQPDAHRVVVAPRHPAQRDRAARRHAGCGATTCSRTGESTSMPDLAIAVGRQSPRIAGPLTLVRGADSPVVVDDEDVAELRRRRPDAVVEVVEGAGHSVQGDQPLELARIIEAAHHAVMNPLEEALDRLDDRYEVMVLEPSPPAVSSDPFTDDPTARVDPPPVGPSSRRSTRASTATSPGTRSLRDDAHLASWCAARALGAWPPPPPLPPTDTFVRTRLSMHALAEHVLCPARHRVNGKIGLRFTRHGFGTPFFGADEQVRVEGTMLVHDVGSAPRGRDADRPLDAGRRGRGHRDRTRRARSVPTDHSARPRSAARPRPRGRRRDRLVVRVRRVGARATARRRGFERFRRARRR